MLVKDLNFGNLAAEGDLIKTDSSAFIETYKYNEMLEPKQRIILGRKGIGKTAFCYEYVKKPPVTYDHVIEIDAKEISFDPFIKVYEEISSRTIGKIDLKKNISQVWEQSIITSCMVLVHNNQKYVGGDKLIISSYLTNQDIATSNLYNVIIRTLKNVPYFLGRNIGEATERIIDDTSDFVCGNTDYDIARQAFFRFVEENEVSFLITFDHLDTYFETKFVDTDENRRVRDAIRNILEGLIQAVYNISISDQLFKFIHFKIFIPMSKYQSINLYDLDKIQQYIFVIRWEKNDLIDFVSRRIAISWNIKSNNQYSDSLDATWYQLFSGKTINNKSLEGKSERIEDFLIRNTFYRPRDLQIYLEEAKKRALRESSLNNSIAPEILYDTVTSKRKEIAESLLKEYEYDCIYLRSLISLFRRSSNFMSYSDQFYPKLRKFHSQRCSHVDIGKLETALYNIGFIGGVRESNDALQENVPYSIYNKKYYYFYFCYYDSHFNIQDSDSIVIHPAFNEYLRLNVNKKIAIG